jgi:high-affinity iron transporter
VTATATRLSAFAALAFAITAGVLWLASRDDAPSPLIRHIAVAPAAQHGARPHGTVVGTRESAQQVADSAIEGTRGPGGRRPDLTPLPTSAFTRPIARYRTYAVGEAHVLARQSGALTAALRAGDRAAARRDWLAAYATYMRIGAAYGALGRLDDAIEGRGNGLHRIERGLWSGERVAALVPEAKRVQAAVAHVPHALRAGPLDPLDYATRAHEILEDAQRDQLSGVLPQWSGAGVLATAADLDATHVVLGTLQPVLAGRGDVLGQVQSRLAELGGVLRSIHRAHRDWPPLQRLSRREHERLTGALGATLEALAGVPGALETALPPVIPAIR